MDFKTSNKAITLGMPSAKMAALFYDEVFPLVLTADSKENEQSHALTFMKQSLPTRVFPYWDALELSGYRLSPGAEKIKDDLNRLIVDAVRKIYVALHNEAMLDPRSADRFTQFEEFLDELNKTEDPAEFMIRWKNYVFTVIGADSYDYIGSGGDFDKGGKTDPAFVLSNLDLIDIDSLHWPQIVAIREDSQAKKRLSRLRTFLFENFDDKPLAYIEDKLGQAMEDYRATAREHGANLRKTALTVATSEKISTSVLAGLTAVVAGANIPISAAVGASALLAGTFLEIRNVRQIHEANQARCPVRYLIDIEDQDSKMC